MGIFKRQNGYYYLRIQTPKGEKRLSLETKDKSLAEEIYQAYLLDKLKQKLIPLFQEHSQISSSPPKSESPLTSTCFTQYLQSCQAQKLTSHVIQAKQRLLKNLQKHRIKHLSEIDQNSVNKLLKEWENLGKDSLDVHVKNLKAFLNFSIKKKWYDRVEYETLSFPTKSTKVKDVVIPEKDYQKLLQAVTEPDFRLYLQTLWETGCRPNEITNLKKSDVDFTKGYARILQNKTKKYKIIYFTDELLEKFQKHNGDELFLGADKQKEYYSKKFKDLKEALNIPKEYCLYAFRHSFGTRMLNKTKDLHLVSKLLGHSDISITAKHYINRSPEEIRIKLLEAHHG